MRGARCQRSLLDARRLYSRCHVRRRRRAVRPTPGRQSDAIASDRSQRLPFPRQLVAGNNGLGPGTTARCNDLDQIENPIRRAAGVVRAGGANGGLVRSHAPGRSRPATAPCIRPEPNRVVRDASTGASCQAEPPSAIGRLLSDLRQHGPHRHGRAVAAAAFDRAGTERPCLAVRDPGPSRTHAGRTVVSSPRTTARVAAKLSRGRRGRRPLTA